MTETTNLRSRLLPELSEELARTRKTLEYLPEGQGPFKPHEKSPSLARLAGHLAEMPGFILLILTTPDLDLASGIRKPLHMESRQQLLAEFDDLADKLTTALKNTSDQTFEQNWRVGAGSKTVFAGERYQAYRVMGINHMIHHRGQVGVYLRLLGEKVPAIYGPSADEPLA